MANDATIRKARRPKSLDLKVPSQTVTLTAAGVYRNSHHGDFPFMAGRIIIAEQEWKIGATLNNNGRFNEEWLININGYLMHISGVYDEEAAPDSDILAPNDQVSKIDGAPELISFEISEQVCSLIWEANRSYRGGGLFEGQIQASFGRINCTFYPIPDRFIEPGTDMSIIGSMRGIFVLQAGAGNFNPIFPNDQDATAKNHPGASINIEADMAEEQSNKKLDTSLWIQNGL